MFTFAEQEQKVIFSFMEHPIVKGIDILVRLHDGTEVPLHLQSIEHGGKVNLKRLGAQSRHVVTFEDDNNSVTARMEIVVKDRAAAVFLRADIKNKELFRDRVTFAPFNGIAIRVRELPELTGLMANYQHKDWWTRPHFDPDLRKLPRRTLSLLWKTNRSYAHLLPVCDTQFRADISGYEGGMAINISAYQGGFNSCETLAFVVGYDENPYRLAENNVDIALMASNAAVKPRNKKSYPEILDYLGWCSWDAFYHQVNAEGLVEKTDEFSKLNLPVRWVMIDDGWSEVSKDKRLRTYDAEKGKFPQGLAPVIREMKEQHGVRWVGVWHTIAGYWGGIDPEGELFHSNRDYLIHTNGDAWLPCPEAAKAFGFWNDWHSYLKRQGVDFVKVDSQSAIANFLVDHAPIGTAARAAHTALEASVGLHFQNCVINCMGMASENIWHRPASSVSRNSDDFMPEEKGSFKEHALQNAYNSFFHGPFYWGDWDMYWTKNHDDLQNMMLRAISGGPIYFSDKVGETKSENVWPLVYHDGKIIRCDRPGQPTEDCLMIDPVKTPVPLKIWNTVGDTGVVAAYHIYEGEQGITGSLSPSDVPGLGGSDFWIYDYAGQNLQRMSKNEKLVFKLKSGEAAMFSLVPIHSHVTPIGLMDKVISTDAVLHYVQDENRTRIRLKEGGQFAFASVKIPVSVNVNGKPSLCKKGLQPNLFIVDCRGNIRETDVEVICE